jgi:hypothetical protein
MNEAVFPHTEYNFTETCRQHNEIFTRMYIIIGSHNCGVLLELCGNYVMILNETLPVETPTYLEHFAS